MRFVRKKRGTVKVFVEIYRKAPGLPIDAKLAIRAFQGSFLTYLSRVQWKPGGFL